MAVAGETRHRGAVWANRARMRMVYSKKSYLSRGGNGRRITQIYTERGGGDLEKISVGQKFVEAIQCRWRRFQEADTVCMENERSCRGMGASAMALWRFFWKWARLHGMWGGLQRSWSRLQRRWRGLQRKWRRFQTGCLGLHKGWRRLHASWRRFSGELQGNAAGRDASAMRRGSFAGRVGGVATGRLIWFHRFQQRL